jgi:tryptophan-rich sensory protein
MTNKILKLAFCIVICELIGIGGAIFTGPAVDSSWYADLIKPSFQPPSWLFGPVWTALYALMGVALYLIWQNKSLVKLFVAQLFFNFLWSVLFFGLKSPIFAFLCIVILWILILVLTIKFFKIKKLAGYLFLPYLLWVTFASILNFSILILNI